MLTAMGDQVARLAEPAALESLVAAARRLARSRWVYCLGLRSSHPAAWQLHYILSLIGERTVLLDSSAGTGADALASAPPQAKLLTVSVTHHTPPPLTLLPVSNATEVANECRPESRK